MRYQTFARDELVKALDKHQALLKSLGRNNKARAIADTQANFVGPSVCNVLTCWYPSPAISKAPACSNATCFLVILLLDACTH